MTSKSRAAQEALAQLEKGSAPFEEQLIEAAKFIGTDLDRICRYATDGTDLESPFEATTYHGREEWLLKWLLKKLQNPQDDVPRKTASSWQLLNYLMRIIPLPTVARILVERKFTSILQRTLEDAKERVGMTSASEREVSVELNSVGGKDTSKKSKKRKRSGELVEKCSDASYGLRSILASILSVVDFMVQSTKALSGKYNEGRSVAFSAEYMKTVMRTTAEDAAKILGLWLSLLKTPGVLFFGDKLPWLSPLIEIWQLHITDDNHLMSFSLHCTLPLLSLKYASGSSILDAQMEELIARNIIIPAKAAKAENAESTLLNDLTRISVLYDSLNAAHLFDIAIRSIQRQGSKRRRPHDDNWLQSVFVTLKEAMLRKRVEQNGKAICAMVQSALEHKVDLELPVLRSITTEFALPEGPECWELLLMIIKLDANVFLIPNDEKDLLQELLTRVTRASIEPSWSEISERVMEDILVPLMGEFAKARDLSGFIHHWYAQLVEFERLRKDAPLSSMEILGAWEDETLQKGLHTLLEASLTTLQIIQLLDWLKSKIGENPDAACVILEAVAGSISREEVVDAVNLRCYQIMFDNNVSERLDDRYRWRSWRILSQTLNWVAPTGVEELSDLWEAQAKPFDSLSCRTGSGSILEIYGGNTARLDALELLRCACAAWTAAKDGSHMQQLARPVLLDILRRLSGDIKSFLQDLQVDADLGKEIIARSKNTQCKGIGWMILSFVHCVFAEYPKVLVLASELKDNAFREMLEIIFRLASVGHMEAATKFDWLRRNGDTFSDLWTSALHCDYILNNSAIIEPMIDIMLSNETYSNNPLVKSRTNNPIAIKSLLELPVGILHRKYRELILKSWLPQSRESPDSAQGTTYEATALDPAVLALKIKVMRQPMFYEGMKFQELVSLGDALADSTISNPQINLALFKELSRLTLEFILTNTEQPRNQEYITDAFGHVRKRIRKALEKSKHKSTYPSITLFELVLATFNAKANILHELGIISKKDLSEVNSSLKESLFLQLQNAIQKPRKEKSAKRKQSETDSTLVILSILDALSALGVDESKLAELRESAKSFTDVVNDTEINVGMRLDLFIASHAVKTSDIELCNQLEGGISTVYGRQSIVEKTQAALNGAENQRKLALLESVLNDSDCIQLDKLLAARLIVLSIEDTRNSTGTENEDSDADEDEPFDLSKAYSILCGHLWKTKGIRQFCLIGETLEVMLRTKARSISQWNIDNTLGSISIICSRNGPAIRSSRAGTIYLHLCHLLQAILTSHRLKLEGHFHIVVQALQALLRCLFTPLPHSSVKTLKYYTPPPWLNPASSGQQLNAKHAAAFTRLITLICDPSVSSVTRSHHNNLTSATDKARRMAGQHMQFVLATYVKLQLEMKMLPEVREKMIPGLYAIFDTTTPELRRCISDSFDSSGRAVFGMLYKDYVRFGKWKGS